jgi:hypothetical protein
MIKVTRASTGFSRVSRRRPCRVCGKPDWCSYTRDEEVSICMRVSDGARRINQHGGAIHIHQEQPASFPEPVVSVTDCPQADLVPIEVRDFVYSRLIALSPAARYRRLLVEGREGLLARGFRECHLTGYGSLPAAWDERDRLAEEILREARSHYPGLSSLLGVPGFWSDARGTHLWKHRNYRNPWLLVPVRDLRGRIQACQLRRAGDGQQPRYCWLSSAHLPHGVGSGSPLHFGFRPAQLPPCGIITITEGALKADALLALRPGVYAVATAGVAASHEALIALTNGRKVLVAFDQDYCVNQAVCLRLAALLARRLLSEATPETTRIASWPKRVKGIDDAALKQLPLSSISVKTWFGKLSPDFRRKVTGLWRDEGIKVSQSIQRSVIS